MTTYEIDATNQSLGRLSTKIATMLRGKHLASYEPRLTPEVEVVVTNIEKVRFTGTKLKAIEYHRYSGYPGGIRTKTMGELWTKKPKFLVKHMVYGMLPKNRTRDKIIKNLKFK